MIEKSEPTCAKEFLEQCWICHRTIKEVEEICSKLTEDQQQALREWRGDPMIFPICQICTLLIKGTAVDLLGIPPTKSRKE